MAKAPLSFVFYIAAPIEKVWNGFVSKEANRAIGRFVMVTVAGAESSAPSLTLKVKMSEPL